MRMGAVEEIDRPDIPEVANEPRERVRSGVRVDFLSTRDEATQILAQFAVIVAARGIEKLNQFRLRQSLDLLRPHQSCVAAVVANLLGQPLELLVLGRVIWQQIRRGLDLHRAHFLQSTPDSDALGVAIGRQTVEKQKPRGRLHSHRTLCNEIRIANSICAYIQRLFRARKEYYATINTGGLRTTSMKTTNLMAALAVSAGLAFG